MQRSSLRPASLQTKISLATLGCRTCARFRPAAVFKERVAELRRWLAARPESSIALVAHWGLLNELTRGGDFANCELRTYELNEQTAELREKVPSLLSLGRFFR